MVQGEKRRVKMELTINNRKIGEITFYMRSSGGYVYADLNGKPGTMGRQICESGSLMGNTIISTGSGFEKTCRNWLRKYVSDLEQNGQIGMDVQ